jgi:hypothetical protein
MSAAFTIAGLGDAEAVIEMDVVAGSMVSTAFSFGADGATLVVTVEAIGFAGAATIAIEAVVCGAVRAETDAARADATPGETAATETAGELFGALGAGATATTGADGGDAG